MKKIFFLRGLPASGKTTWAKRKLASLNRGGKIRAIRTNKDEIRLELAKTGGSSESKVIRRETELVTDALNAGLHVITDNTHFNPVHEWRYRALAKEYGYAFEIVRFSDVKVKECVRRDQDRPNSVGASVIQKMEDYRKSLRPDVVAYFKEQWLARMVPAMNRKQPAAKNAIEDTLSLRKDSAKQIAGKGSARTPMTAAKKQQLSKSRPDRA